MEDIDRVLEKWVAARNNIAILEKKIDNYKKLMTQFMSRNNLTKYENDVCRVKQSKQNRSFIIKKDVPQEIWEQYAKPQQIEFLTITEKKTSKQQQTD